MNDLYKKIKNKREELGYTQRYMADQLDIDAATYSRIENGKIDITVSRLEGIAFLLKVEAGELLASHASHALHTAYETTPVLQDARVPKVTLQIELDDNIKADVIKLAFGDRVLEIKNK